PKVGQPAEAIKLYDVILKSDPGLTDEYGVPLALYAAAPLLEGGNAAAIAPILSGLMRDPGRLSTKALYKMREAANRIQASSIPEIDRLIREREQAEALQADFPRLLPLLRSDDLLWLPYGEPLWLISLARADGTPPTLVAVRAASLGAITGSVRIVLGREGEPLGENFPTLRAVFLRQPIQNGGLRPVFLLLTLLFVIALTFFAGSLLW